MRASILLGVVLTAPFFFGCTQTGQVRGSLEAIRSSLGGDMEIKGEGVAVWPEGAVQEEPNFVWEYETIGYRRDVSRPNHHMKTSLRLRYDPAERRITSATVASAEKGHCFRHVCLTPGPDGLLMIRMATLLDNRDEDLTVVRVHGPDPSTHTCEDIGVGPGDGLMEGMDVLFKEDGSFTVIPGSKAYLAGSDLRLERTATLSSDLTQRHAMTLPR